MGALTPSGSLPQPLLPKSNDKLVETADETPHNETHLDRQLHVKDTFHNRTALNVSRDAGVISALQGFAAGSPIIVTWFLSMESTADKQSTLSDFSWSSAAANYGYHRINNFEIRLQEPLDFSYNPEETESAVTGNALIYPGFMPTAGDVFIYEVEPGMLGLFKVTGAAQRLSIKTRTSHVVPFELEEILTEAHIAELLERVREESWFSKRRFLNESTALLTRDDVMDLDYISDRVSEMLRYYIDKFFDAQSYHSFARADGIYDPYVVWFIQKTINLFPYNVYAEQLVNEVPFVNRSFWAKLLSPKTVDWDAHVHDTYVDTYQVSAVGARVTSLLNRAYVILTDDLTDVVDPYLYISDQIGGIDTNLFSDFDTLISFYMEYQVIDVDILWQLVDDIYSESDMNQFYRIPIFVFFAKLLEESLHSGKNMKLAVPDQLPYREIEITQPSDEFTGELLTITSPHSKVVGIVSNTGTQIYPEPVDVAYTAEGFTIDFTSIKAEYSIVGDLPGTWKVVISNTALVLM